MCLFTCMHVCTFREWQCGNEGGCQRRGWCWCAVTRDLLKVWSASCLFRPTTQAFKNNSATARDMQPIYLYNTFNMFPEEKPYTGRNKIQKSECCQKESNFKWLLFSFTEVITCGIYGMIKMLIWSANTEECIFLWVCFADIMKLFQLVKMDSNAVCWSTRFSKCR